MFNESLLTNPLDKNINNGQDKALRPVKCLRWYVLFVASLIAFEQGWVWNTYGPIALVVEQASVFNWDDGVISTLGNWGPIAFLVWFLPTAWMLDNSGLRTSALLSSVFISLGCGCRLLWTGPTFKCTVVQHIGQALNGLAGPFANSAGPLISAQWFPRYQRTTATGLYTVACILGISSSYLVGPLMVPSSGTVNDIREYLWLMFYASCATTLLAIIYLPNRPPRGFEPSKTAGLDRTESSSGLRMLLVTKDFWFLALAYGVMTGVYCGWGALYELIVQKILSEDGLHKSGAQELAAQIGFCSFLAGSLAGFVISAVNDACIKRITMRMILMCLSLGGTLLYVALCILIHREEWIEYAGISTFFAVCVLAGVCILGSYPIFYETAVEAVYPIGEGLSTLVMTTMSYVFSLIFLLLPAISVKIGTWVIYVSAASCLFSLLCVYFFNGQLKRVADDLDENDKD